MEILIFSWRSIKQEIFANSSNHVEIIAIYEVNREFVCSRSVNQSKIFQQYYLKIMQLISLKLEEVISKVI